MWLSDLFAVSEGEPVEYEQHTVYAAWRRALPATPGLLSVEFMQDRPDRDDLRQGIRIAIAGGWFDNFRDTGEDSGDVVAGVNGEVGEELPVREVEAWTDVGGAMPFVLGFVPDADLPANVMPELAVWNIWDVDGVVLEFCGQGGMLVDQEPDGAVVLRCSHGADAPQFDNLVVRIQPEVLPDRENSDGRETGWPHSSAGSEGRGPSPS